MAAADEQLTGMAKKVLGGAGAKLHTHEVHLRRTANRGYIAKHDLRDKNGNHPQDGQRSEAEYSLASKAAMLKHLEQHMGDLDQDDQGDQGTAPQPQGGAPAAQPVQ